MVVVGSQEGTCAQGGGQGCTRQDHTEAGTQQTVAVAQMVPPARILASSPSPSVGTMGR